MVALFTIASASCAARDIVLAWDPNLEPDIAGYVVRYGTSSGQYTHTIQVLNGATVTLAGLTPGTYYATVTARNLAGLESLPSDELSFGVTLQVPSLAGLSDGQALNGPAPVVLRAAEFGPDITRVEFFLGNVRLGEINSITESVTWVPTDTGTFGITVKGHDAFGNIVSATVWIQIVRPAVEEMRWAGGQAFEFTVIGAPGSLQHVEWTDDLSKWQPLVSAVNSTGRMNVRDPDAMQQTRRFYRVKSE